MRKFQKTDIQLVDWLARQLEYPPAVPRRGWIQHARTGRHLSTREFAKRMGIAPSSAHELEQREWSGSITLNKLAQVAQVLDLDLVYGFVPHLEPFFDLEVTKPETLEELFWASLEDDKYRKILIEKYLALQAEEEALVRAHIEDASVGEGKVLAPLAGEDPLEHIPGLA
jgi:transcriptional regulator with XRE-family HTH domain